MKPMLAQDYAESPPRGWLMSEKLDGMRALWDGAKLVSREGNLIHAPAWFTSDLPPIPLDGELWIERGTLQQLVSVVRKKVPDDAEWRQVQYMVFDAPAARGRFSRRLKIAAAHCLNCLVAKPVSHIVCRDRSHLDAFYGELIEARAEGVVLRDPEASYQPGRSASYLRLKPSFTAEAVVRSHTPGNGRNSHVVGALICEWQGVVFSIGAGLNDEARANPPPVGCLVTFAFLGLTHGGKPRSPSFIIRRDYE